MRYHQPGVQTLSESTRLMFRSRHIYILASGLVNLMLGLYLQRRAVGWRGITQTIGSGLLIGSSALLILAFSVESKIGFQQDMRWSANGLYALFSGCMAHFASSIGKLQQSTKDDRNT